jgi:hypothetical protein
MQIQKLIRQFGEHGNEYSPVEVGDKINEIIDVLNGVKTSPQTSLEPLQATKEPKANYTPIEAKPEGVAVRSPATADMVYLVKDGKKHWIKNPETLKKLGFDFQKIKNITNKEMNSFETSKPIDLKEKPIEVKKAQDEFDKYNL